MLPDLERLIRLQDLETRVERVRAAIAAIPERLAALDAAIAAGEEAISGAKQRLAENQVVRRGLEKDLATAQARLSRFKDQLMEVKTNKEYQAMQKEIAAAEHEVRSVEDRLLESLLAADERSEEVRKAEADLRSERAAAEEEGRALDAERQRLEAEIAQALSERERVVSALDPGLLALYEQVARARKGIAVAEARGGLCSICNVRLRPQVFNEIRRNEAIIQCDSCKRILYFVATVANHSHSQAGGSPEP